MIEFQISKK